MKIGIIPSVKEPFKNQFEYSIDIKLISFLNKIFPKHSIKVLNLNDKFDKKIKLLVISGGNSIKELKKTKKNLIRSKLDNKFYNFAKKKRVPIIGICHGAQFIASKYECSFKRKKHIGNHRIFFKNNKKSLIVNSYHNFIIKNFKNDNVKVIAYSKDKSIEYFQVKNHVGIMWHPERNKIFKEIDKKIFSDLLCI